MILFYFLSYPLVIALIPPFPAIESSDRPNKRIKREKGNLCYDLD